MTVPPSLAGRVILVTGGAGFLGRTLVAQLIARGACVRILDDLSASGGIYPPGVADESIILRGSVMEKGAVRDAAGGVDLIVHLASIVGMRKVHTDPERAFQVSDQGTATLLAETGDTPVVLVSSSCVYGLRETASVSAAVTERACLAYDGGRRGYACGKLRLEQRGAGARSRGRRVLTVRPFNVVGPGQDPDQGMVVPTFVRSALRGEALRVFGDGTQSRSFSDIDYFAERLLALISTPSAWMMPNAIFNIGSGETTSITELAKLILQATGSDSQIQYVPFEKIYPGRQDVQHRKPDESALTQLIGPSFWPSIQAIAEKVIIRDSNRLSATKERSPYGNASSKSMLASDRVL